jgi:hypothetical protein
MEEVFSAASQHCVLYGMGFAPPAHLPAPTPMALRRMDEVRQRARAAAADLPSNRAYFTALTGAIVQP